MPLPPMDSMPLCRSTNNDDATRNTQLTICTSFCKNACMDKMAQFKVRHRLALPGIVAYNACFWPA